MRKYTVLVLALVCVLGLFGCSTENNKETQLGNTSIETPEKEGETDKTLIDDDAVDNPTEDIVTDIATPNLTMRTLKSLVDRYGEDLTWDTFDTYYCEEITSGLYTRSYPIDTEYSLLIIGDTDKTPTAILLTSAHSDNVIDIRTNSIDDFINGKYNYEELSEMPAKELLDLFIQSGLVINDDLKASFTEEELQTLFKENFHLWHTGVSAHSHTMYCDLAEQTKEIFDKIAEPSTLSKDLPDNAGPGDVINNSNS